MTTKLEIANLSLSHLGYGKPIANLTTERSAEANAVNRFYDLALDSTLRDHDWTFATTFADLGLVEEDPNEEWAFSYRYPSDCVNFRRILSGSRNDSLDSAIKFKLGGDATGRLVFTDLEDAECEYTARITDTSKYPSDFIMALSLRLAVYIAPFLTKGDPFKVGNRAMSLYMSEIQAARANSSNEERLDLPPDPELIRARM